VATAAIVIPAASAKGIKSGAAKIIINNKSYYVVLKSRLVYLQGDL
jgi:hypothetical protein